MEVFDHSGQESGEL